MRSTSWSRRCRSGWRSSGRCSRSSTPPRPATRSWPATPRRCRSPRWATRLCGPTRWSASTSSIPASVMRLIEVVEGEETSEETVQATVNFAQQIRKMPIRCGEAPGFVVNRVLNSAASEIWRHKDESGASAQEIDKEIAEAKVTPMGPVLPQRPAGARHRRCTSPSTCRSRTASASTSHPRCRSWWRPATRAEDRQGLLRARRGGTEWKRDRTADRRDRRALHAEGVRRGVPRARGGRREPARTSRPG